MAPAKEYDFNPYNFPPELLQAIGLVLTSAAQTESLIQEAIAGCAGIDAEYGGAITTHMNMPLRFSALRSVAEIRIESLDDLDELDQLIEAAEKAFEKRNAIAHHQWARDPDTNEMFMVKAVARTSFRMDLIPMTVEEVKADALFIYEVGLRFIQFLGPRGLMPKLPPLRPRFHKLKTERKKRRQKLSEQTTDERQR